MLQVVLLGISLIFIYSQLRVYRQANMLQIIGGFDARWVSTTFSNQRARVCSKYDASAAKLSREEIAVLGFFEDLAVYLKRGIIDTSLVWDKYSYSIEYYWALFQPRIMKFRSDQNDKTFYDQFEYMNGMMASHASSQALKYGKKDNEELEAFRRHESELLPS